jgi:serine/threonine protein phosphatase PrpC
LLGLQAGGFIAEGRVNGSLNLSRAFGDMEFKRSSNLSPAQQMITANPEVRTLQLQRGDEFLILACDGIWDVLTNQAVSPSLFVSSPSLVARVVCRLCLEIKRGLDMHAHECRHRRVEASLG